MGFLYSSKRIRSYVLILLAIISLIVAGPVRLKLNSLTDKVLNQLTALIHEKTGLSISYKSLSPSVLSNLYIKGIDIYDDEENSVLTIEKTRINYNLFKLLKGDFSNGITNVVVDGIILDVDKLINLLNYLPAAASSSSSFDFMQLKQNIPANVSLKNIILEYEHERVSAQLAVKAFSISNSASKKMLNVQFSSSAKAFLKDFKQNLSCRLELSGNLTDILDNSQFTLKLSDLTNGDIRLNKLNLHVDYNNNVIGLRTIQSVNPVSIGADINLRSGDINAQLKADKLNPLALVNISTKQKGLRKLKDFTLITDSIL